MVIEINSNNSFSQNNNYGTILIFTEGTILKHKSIFQKLTFKTYIPINNCVEKIKCWNEQGYEIKYLTSRKTEKEVNYIKDILEKYNFSGNCLYYRNIGEEYQTIAEEIMPKILIEDNCKSIGGIKQTTIYKINKDKKSLIKSILVDEFKGIDHLPNNVMELMNYENKI